VAPLLPKLRGQVAEFLNQCSLDRLGMLYLPTCVGLGYGLPGRSLEAFLGSRGSPTSPHSARTRASGWTPKGPVHRICLADHPTHLPHVNQRVGWATFLRHPIARPHRTWVTRARHPRKDHEPCLVPCGRRGRDQRGTGISTGRPSTTPLGLALGPDSPWAD
jgi:hypothetical protein